MPIQNPFAGLRRKREKEKQNPQFEEVEEARTPERPQRYPLPSSSAPKGRKSPSTQNERGSRPSIPIRRSHSPLKLRVGYWHRSAIGECPNNQRTLAAFLVKFVALLSEESSDFPWSCEVTPSDFMQDKPVAHHIVSIKVDFTHKTATHDQRIAYSQSRLLWKRLQELTTVEEFKKLFGSVMIGLSMTPINVPKALGTQYAHGLMVQKLCLQPNDIVNVRPHPLAFVGDSSYIMKQLIPVLRSYQANKVTSTDKSITFEEELAALDQIMAILSSGFPATDPKAKIKDIAQRATETKRHFDETHILATSHLTRLCEKQNLLSRHDDTMESLLAVNKLILIHKRIGDCLRELVASWEKSKHSTNVKWGVVAGVSGLIALVAVLCLMAGPISLAWIGPGLVISTGTAQGVAIGATVVSLVTSGSTAVKAIIESSRVEKILQQTNEVLTSLQKLNFHLAAYWIEEVWDLSFDAMETTSRHELLKSFGVDPTYFAKEGYQRNMIADAFELFKESHKALTESFKELYTDLGITVSREFTK